MLIQRTTLTDGLRRWLRTAHDDGEPQLRVEQAGPDVRVLRASGDELSPTEQDEIVALLAAHEAEPLR